MIKTVDSEVSKIETKLFLERLKEYQKMVEMTPEDMAYFFGVQRATYYKYMNGTLSIPVKNCIAFVNEFKVNCNYLFMGDFSQGYYNKDSKSSLYDFQAELNNMRGFVMCERGRISQADVIKYANCLAEITRELTKG